MGVRMGSLHAWLLKAGWKTRRLRTNLSGPCQIEALVAFVVAFDLVVGGDLAGYHHRDCIVELEVRSHGTPALSLAFEGDT